MNEEMARAMVDRNRRRHWWQQLGLVFIIISFLLQGVAQYAD
jgi:hypothetical protein